MIDLDKLDDDEDTAGPPKVKTKVRQRTKNNKNSGSAPSSSSPPAEDKTAKASSKDVSRVSQEEDGGGQSGPVDPMVPGAPPVVAEAEPEVSAFERAFGVLKSLLWRGLFMYFLMTFLRGKGPVPAANQTPGTPGQTPGIRMQAENAFSNGTIYDLQAYLSDNPIFDKALDTLVWSHENLVYGDWVEVSMSMKVPIRKTWQQNGTIYLHCILVNTLTDKFPLVASTPLTKYRKEKLKVTKNLLEATEESSSPSSSPPPDAVPRILSHYHGNLTLNLVTDWTMWTQGAVPVPLDKYVEFVLEKEKDKDATGRKLYLPILFPNDYWNLQKDYWPLSTDNSTLPLNLHFQPISLFKWQLYAAQQVRNSWNFMESPDQAEDDTLKEAMLDTNPYLLGLTFVISVLHSIFEFLAFKNDIQFWNNRKSLEGLSVRSVFFNVFQSLIVLLYVLDNETNFVIKISCGVGLLIEIWKIQKVTDVTFSWATPWRLTFKDKESYKGSTKEYDRLAYKYLSILCFPLFFAYCVYSLLYNEHKSLYSFILGCCYGYLLTFGFIMMTPQLFINYKLKSVAHLPWRMLSYKFLNTFIDDIFAFVIKMPTMYRIGCLRDDVIFFIYLFQRWRYRTDYTRQNEFGYTGVEAEGVAAAADVKNAVAANNGNEASSVEDTKEKEE